MAVRAGIGLQGWPFEDRESARLWDFIDTCEALGVDSIWVSDRIVSTGFGLESMSILAAIAARTRRMKFGNSVLALPLRNPTVLAKEIATIDFISQGRMIPAVGLGADNPLEFEACGVKMRERAGRTDEAIVLMRRLWTEDSVTFRGRYYNVTDAHIEPRTFMKPCPPIWIGGRTEAALRRTGRLGDGWLASAVTPSEVKAGIQTIQKHATEAGRVVPDDHFGVIVPFYIGGSRGVAMERAAPFVRTRPGAGTGDISAFGAFGTGEDVAKKVGEYVEAGATKFVMRAACSPAETLSQIELVARQAIPTIQSMAA